MIKHVVCFVRRKEAVGMVTYVPDRAQKRCETGLPGLGELYKKTQETVSRTRQLCGHGKEGQAHQLSNGQVIQRLPRQQEVVSVDVSLLRSQRSKLHSTISVGSCGRASIEVYVQD